jgi:hypothetical protein
MAGASTESATSWSTSSWTSHPVGPQFLTILRRQREDAVDHGQEDRAQLFEGFLKEIDGDG